MSHIQSDINLHELTMLVLNRSEFTSCDPDHLATEIAQKYIATRRIMLEELKQHTNPGTMVIK